MSLYGSVMCVYNVVMVTLIDDTTTKYQIKAEYPCCHKEARFTLYPPVPKQRFDRKCLTCKLDWNILVKSNPFLGDGFIHVIEWEL